VRRPHGEVSARRSKGVASVCVDKTDRDAMALWGEILALCVEILALCVEVPALRVEASSPRTCGYLGRSAECGSQARHAMDQSGLAAR
jgi:hypothetical protein